MRFAEVREMPREFADSTLYIVVSGDSCDSIARRHACTVGELLGANAGLISDPNFIQAGWELLIPGKLTGNRREAPPIGAGVALYSIDDGDTLGALANRWETTVAAIAELNGIANPALIFVGQRIRRPGTEGVVAAEPAAATEIAVAEPLVSEPQAFMARTDRLTFERWPVDMPPAIITGGYRQDYGGYLHRGIDLGGMRVGTPIFAPAGGMLTVHRPGDGWGNGSFGICAVIDHPGTPWWTIYAHMNDTHCTTGDVVAAGEIIGEVGFTGRVEPPGPAGAHLHWQLSAHSGFPQGFEYIANPLDFFG